MHLQSGDIAEDFILKDQNNNDISLDIFGDKIIILYFYPKDMTKGCSIEANEFSSNFASFRDRNCVILGVSGDSLDSHKKFIKKENLSISLLSDPSFEVCKKYGVYAKKSMYGREYMGIIRSTFIIKDKVILKAFYNVKSSGHAMKILKEIENIVI